MKGVLMPVKASEVTVDAFFITTNKQLRKVTEIVPAEKTGTRVHYLRKSAIIPGRKFEFGSTKAKPPLLKNFIAVCDHVLSEEDVNELRQKNIILQDE
jgi:hypothetical protein